MTIYPSDRCGTYRMPRRIFELLEVRLRGFKNRINAHRLACFLARMNAAPDRFGRVFPIDRRALADNATLGMPEYAIRGALRTLEAIGFVDRQPEPRGPYERTDPTLASPRGGVKRRPIRFRFGLDFVGFFAWIVRKSRSRMSYPKERTDINSQNYNPTETKKFKPILSLGQKPTAMVQHLIALAQARSGVAKLS